MKNPKSVPFLALRWLTYDELVKENISLKSLYLTAFTEIYKDHLDSIFFDDLSTFFDNELEDFKENQTTLFLVLAETNNLPAGFAFFRKITETEFSLDLIGVHPDYWRMGIGKKLVFSIKEKCPSCEKIKLVTYKINTQSPLFYEALGFKKSNYVKPDCNPEEVQGFEFSFDEGA